MNRPGQWSRLKDILDAALSLEGQARNIYVQAACRGDTALLAEVDEFLQQEAQIGNFLGGFTGRHTGPPVFDWEALFQEYLQSALAMPTGLPETDRFRQVEKIGAGGFGEVYKAFDSARDQIVAIKVSRLTDRETVARFKREFRSLARITHPNILALYELFGNDVRWFFTMEHLSGSNFRDYLGSVTGDLRIQRLRGGLFQMIEGLNALHRADIIHRDIKPSNVWVTQEQRLVLLDFGLVQTIHEGQSDSNAPFAGTPHYCSPEQAAGGVVTIASDWYAVGVMLYEALTDRLPFPGHGAKVLSEKQERDAPAPSALSPGIPRDLDELCRQLLGRDPLARLAGIEHFRRRDGLAQALARTPVSDTAAAPLIGRSAESAALREAWNAVREGRPAAVYVTGESGFGKSLLLSSALAEMRQQGAVIFSARCYATESVPYKGLDELVELLGRYLGALPSAELETLLPASFPLVTSLFPALSVHREAAHPEIKELAPEITDARERRKRAFGALWELLSRLSGRASLVISIDDLQWGDSDSLDFFVPFFNGNAPPVLLLLAYRQEDADSSALLVELRKNTSVSAPSFLRTIRLQRLSDAEGEQLTRVLLAHRGIAESAGIVNKIVHAAGCDPFLIREFARFAASPSPTEQDGWDSADVLRERLAGLPEFARHLLELIAVAGQPIDLGSAARAWQGSGDFLGARRLLIAESLLRIVGEANGLVVYHDRIREAAVRELDQSRERFWHGRLAVALEASPSPDPERLAGHFDRAQQREPAARYARMSADRARNVFAFERAAHFYKMALSNTNADLPTRSELLSLRAETLGNAGRGPDSAADYLAAADGASAGDSLRLHTGAVVQYLRSGYLTKAFEMLPILLGKIGMTYPATNRGALISLLWTRFRIRLRMLANRRAKPVSLDELAKIDVCWSVALGISMVDPLHSALFSAKHLLLALALGEPGRLAMARAAEATQRAGLDGGYGISDRFIREALESAEQCDDPRVSAFVIAMRGVLACLRGEWKQCYIDCQHAAVLLRECRSGPGWELTTSIMFTISMRFMLGEWPDVISELPGLIREAEQRGELYATLNFQLLTSYHVALLIKDDPARAEKMTEELLGLWDRDLPDLQHYYAFTAIADSCVYSGDGNRAWAVVEERWTSLEQAGIFRFSLSRIFGKFVRAKCALLKASCLAKTSPGRLHLLHLISALAASLEQERFPYARALGRLLQAALAAARGRRDPCLILLREAIGLLESSEMIPWKVSAAYWQAQLTGDSEAFERASNWMRERGCQRPDRIARLFAPGEWRLVSVAKFLEMR